MVTNSGGSPPSGGFTPPRRRVARQIRRHFGLQREGLRSPPRNSWARAPDPNVTGPAGRQAASKRLATRQGLFLLLRVWDASRVGSKKGIHQQPSPSGEDVGLVPAFMLEKQHVSPEIRLRPSVDHDPAAAYPVIRNIVCGEREVDSSILWQPFISSRFAVDQQLAFIVVTIDV